MSDEEYLNMLVKDHYWKDIQDAFRGDCDDKTYQIYFRNKYYQCKMENKFCIGASECE